MDIEVADAMPDGWKMWLDWHQTIAPDNHEEIRAIEDDAGRYIGYVRVVGRRRDEVELPERIESVPSHYTNAPLLRSDNE